MEGDGRNDQWSRRVAAAGRRRRPEVYRRRRITVLAGLSVLLILPWCASRRSAEPASTAGANQPGAAPADQCAVAVAGLPLRSRLALTLMIGVDGDAPDDVSALIDEVRPGGIFVRAGRAVWDDSVLATPLRDGLPLLVAVDDEGGRVQPLQGVLDDLPSAAALADESPDALRAMAATRGADLLERGITVVFAPVVDVGQAGGIGDRSFGDTSDVVVSKAGAYAAGLRDAGVLPVLKHFPGQGHADADTHEGPGVVPALELLRTSDLVPYDTLLADGPTGVMVGHLDVPDLTEPGVPASLSPAAIGLLRGGYEFDGLVVTDDLAAMGAVTSRFSVPEAAERALAAGADVVLLAQPTDVGRVLDRLEEAVNIGRIPDRRIDAALARIEAVGCPA